MIKKIGLESYYTSAITGNKNTKHSLWLQHYDIVAISGLDAPEGLHSFFSTPRGDGATLNVSRLDQRRISITFNLLTKTTIGYLPYTDKEKIIRTNLQVLNELSYKDTYTMKIIASNFDTGIDAIFFLHNVYIESISYPIFSESVQYVTIDLVSEESYICGAETVMPFAIQAPNPQSPPPPPYHRFGTTRGHGVKLDIRLTGTDATQVRIINANYDGSEQIMIFNVPAGSNRKLEVDTRFGRKSITLNGENAINCLTYDSKWFAPDNSTPYIYYIPGTTSTDPNYYIDYTTSSYIYESATLGVDPWYL